MKPTTPRLAPKQQPLKPTAPLRPATAPKRPFPTRKGDGGFNPTQVQASKGDTGFTREISDAPGQQQGQSYTKVAHNFPRSLLETTHKRCNYNDVNSWFEIAAGELRATFKSHRCGWHRRGRRARECLAAVPVGGGGAWPGQSKRHKRRRCGGCRRVRRARAGFEIDHSEPLGSRVAISRAAGPDGARNTSGATSTVGDQAGRKPQKVRTPRSTPGSGRPGGRRGGRAH